MPSPPPTLLRVQDSPVPTHTVLGLPGSMATAPIDWAWSSKTGRKVVPPSRERRPPPAGGPTVAAQRLARQGADPRDAPAGRRRPDGPRLEPAKSVRVELRR